MKIALGGLQSAKPKEATTHFDLLVIGGGSGGLAASKAAAQLGKKVAVCNFVKPSPQGTTWGLGGTCVNVGCVPKKLMWTAATFLENAAEATGYGLQYSSPPTLSWPSLVAKRNAYVERLNGIYARNLDNLKIERVVGTVVRTVVSTVGIIDCIGTISSTVVSTIGIIDCIDSIIRTVIRTVCSTGRI